MLTTGFIVSESYLKQHKQSLSGIYYSAQQADLLVSLEGLWIDHSLFSDQAMW